MQIQFLLLCMHDLSTNKIIRGFQALPQPRASLAGLEPATEGSLQISGQVHYQLHAFTLLGNLVTPWLADDLKINRAPTPETNQAPKGSGSLRAQI
ncbi:hypothetical protein PoB_000000400 [Plakobranchus ocellatus]|uniref:Uncharacterized protein n=1 Tax=Plakobranchus ocellatus TaxID=259542 RepID=A0AAV3XP42_9GAST|nr:hypothetical protein PoB_000000400 [Plakobranchus ocellatus]